MIADSKSIKSYRTIYDFISDHDCNDGKLTKTILAKNCEMGLRTIKRYLKRYPTLNDHFNTVSELSMTDYQAVRQQYNGK